jgi:hypothetical protein
MFPYLQNKLTYLKEKNLHTWLGGYARHLLEDARAPRAAGPRHLMFALCDHWEPGGSQGGTTPRPPWATRG